MPYNANASGTVDSSDVWHYLVYEKDWQLVATYRESSETLDVSPKEQFTYHNAGVDGVGGSSYIDSVIMRDKDANTAWATASGDGVLEERRVYCQNWRGDVSALITDTGKMVEWVKYSAYGVAMGLPCGDTDSDGDWDATDSTAIGGSLDPRDDSNLDGVLNASDVTQANSITGGYQTLGRTVLSSTAVANRKGYAGYENDGSVGDQYHVRYRVYRPTLGRWAQRDPVGYRDGMSLYEYVRSRVGVLSDPTGLSPDDKPCETERRAAAAAIEDVTNYLLTLPTQMPWEYPAWYEQLDTLLDRMENAVRTWLQCLADHGIPAPPPFKPVQPSPGKPISPHIPPKDTKPITAPPDSGNPCTGDLDNDWPPTGYGDGSTCADKCCCTEQVMDNIKWCVECFQKHGNKEEIWEGCFRAAEKIFERCLRRCHSHDDQN
jgi:RHS repeat-associated protein